MIENKSELQSLKKAAVSAKPDYIADNLKALYRSTEQEPLPDRFKDLLGKLAMEDRS